MLRIGCHLSSSKGYCAMAKDALEIRANTFQYFSRNPRGGNAKALDQEDIARFLVETDKNDIHPFLAHAPYTLNGCSADPALRDFARRTMADDLARLEFTPGNLYNFHPGSHVKQGADVGISYIADMLNEILKPDQTTTVLLETMSGKGSEVGRTFEELKAIIDKVELNSQLGVCFDTCHVWDAGYDIADHLDDVISEFDRIIGLDKLCAIHLNDSKNVLGSHKDRHECLGAGNLTMDAIIRIINHPALRDLPFYLETPNDLEGYAREIAMLKAARKV